MQISLIKTKQFINFITYENNENNEKINFDVFLSTRPYLNHIVILVGTFWRRHVVYADPKLFLLSPNNAASRSITDRSWRNCPCWSFFCYEHNQHICVDLNVQYVTEKFDKKEVLECVNLISLAYVFFLATFMIAHGGWLYESCLATIYEVFSLAVV